ncbi:MAG: glycoside hydrolase family 25 protein [Gammaproteobacteria bacterium]
MKRLIVFVIFLSGTFAARAAETPSEFFAPWSDGAKAIVIDPYEGNDIDWDKLATDKRVVAIIHKATEGPKTDSKYASRKTEALKRGYLWGSYHLGRPGDPVKQADHYLKVTDPGADELIALDLESISSSFMSLDGARQFIEHILQETQRYPLLYVNHATAKHISNKAAEDKMFARCPLWYARFRKNIPDFPRGTWATYTLWQFSSEINCSAQGTCLYNVPGTRFDMDVNVFFGTPGALKAQWPLTRILADPPEAHEGER